MVQMTDGSDKMSEKLETPAHPMKASGKRMRLGELLIQAGLIDTESLNEALSLQKVQASSKVERGLFQQSRNSTPVR